jgi:hypothetical protein
MDFEIWWEKEGKRYLDDFDVVYNSLNIIKQIARIAWLSSSISDIKKGLYEK